jgi:hypothetical protein
VSSDQDLEWSVNHRGLRYPVETAKRTLDNAINASDSRDHLKMGIERQKSQRRILYL